MCEFTYCGYAKANTIKNLEVNRLNQPIECKIAGGKTLTVSETVLLSLSLTTAAGPVNIVEPVECLILKGDDEEFLVGKDVLAILGIDIERQLELLASPSSGDGEDGKEEPVVTHPNVQDGEDIDVHKAVETTCC